MKILVTAFKPFNKLNNNYSEEVLKYIENVDKYVLDVVYDKCFLELKEHFNLNEYDFIIALGEARSRTDIMLETTALNLSSCSIKDNLGILKQNETIDFNVCDKLNTLVNIKNLKNLIKFSNDAGKFVCNNLYFHLLKEYQKKALFIHIPNCFDQVDEYQKYASLIEKIINILKGEN